MHSVFFLAFVAAFYRLSERLHYPEEHRLWESTVCRKIDTAGRFLVVMRCGITNIAISKSVLIRTILRKYDYEKTVWVHLD